jgi:hypothetical protein
MACYHPCLVYAFFRKAYEKLQLEKEQEVGMLKEQNQRLQVQLNNSQLSLQDLKRKSSEHIQELETRISLLTRKVIMITFSVL